MSVDSWRRARRASLVTTLVLITGTTMAAVPQQLTFRQLDIGYQRSPEAVTAALATATVATGDMRVGSEALLARSVFVTRSGSYEVLLEPASNDQHRRLTIRHTREGIDGAGRQTRTTVASEPREIELGKPAVVVLPADGRYAIEVCTAAIGVCPNIVGGSGN